LLVESFSKADLMFDTFKVPKLDIVVVLSTFLLLEFIPKMY